MAGHVFISYSRTDSVYVAALVAYLVAAGIPVWIDDAIDFGAHWEDVICEKIDTCSVLVAVMSPEAARSTWVRNEISRARRREKPVLPLLLAGEPFFSLDHVEYEDVSGAGMPKSAFLDRLRKLTVFNAVVAEEPDEVVYLVSPVQSAPRASWDRYFAVNLIGNIVPGTVTRLFPTGAVVSVGDGIEAFVVNSELAADWVESPAQVVRVGSVVMVKIVGADSDHLRISLSLRQADEGFIEGEEHFDPTIYGMAAEYDGEGNFVYPSGFDPGGGEWLSGSEKQRDEWEARYMAARSRWEKHTQQVIALRNNNVLPKLHSRG